MSPTIGYGSNYDFLHFAYDLNLYDTPMRVLMKGHSLSPLYWKSVHFASLDLVNQIGYPKIFWTISLYEWSFPYHTWITDEMSKELRTRLHLPIAETLHMTHCLLQVVKGA
eukprot:1906023-Amphidinium_carterae.1